MYDITIKVYKDVLRKLYLLVVSNDFEDLG